MEIKTENASAKDLSVEKKYPFLEMFKKEIITRDDGVPYLIRNTLFRIGRYFSIKYHKIVTSDDACLHDHPWPFISIILKGGYYEWTYATEEELARGYKDKYVNIFKRGKDGEWLIKKWYGPGRIIYRPANWAHRLELSETVKFNAENKRLETVSIPCHTLIFTGKIVRPWGFFTPTGWMPWRKYSRNENC